MKTDRIETDRVQTDGLQTDKVQTGRVQTDRAQTDSVRTGRVQTDRVLLYFICGGDIYAHMKVVVAFLVVNFFGFSVITRTPVVGFGPK